MKQIKKLLYRKLLSLGVLSNSGNFLKACKARKLESTLNLLRNMWIFLPILEQVAEAFEKLEGKNAKSRSVLLSQDFLKCFLQ